MHDQQARQAPRGVLSDPGSRAGRNLHNETRTEARPDSRGTFDRFSRPNQQRVSMIVNYISLPVFDDSGYVVLDRYDQAADPQEWLDVDYVGWRSSGASRFAPLASAYGELECDGFWNHTPPKTDKDGVWVQQNIEKAPRLKARAEEPGANIGRCRVIELPPNEYADCIYNLHRDDNNRLNPEGTGWVVRGFFNLTDDADTVMILRDERDDPSTETRIPLPAGTQVIIDTQRLWHAVWHPGPEPRYCLITSWESGPELGRYIDARHPQERVASAEIDPDLAAAAYRDAAERRAARERALRAPAAEVMSEA